MNTKMTSAIEKIMLNGATFNGVATTKLLLEAEIYSCTEKLRTTEKNLTGGLNSVTNIFS